MYLVLCSSLISSKMKSLKYLNLNFKLNFDHPYGCSCQCEYDIELEFHMLKNGDKSSSNLESLIIGGKSTFI